MRQILYTQKIINRAHHAKTILGFLASHSELTLRALNPYNSETKESYIDQASSDTAREELLKLFAK